MVLRHVTEHIVKVDLHMACTVAWEVNGEGPMRP